MDTIVEQTGNKEGGLGHVKVPSSFEEHKRKLRAYVLECIKQLRDQLNSSCSYLPASRLVKSYTAILQDLRGVSTVHQLDDIGHRLKSILLPIHPNIDDSVANQCVTEQLCNLSDCGQDHPTVIYELLHQAHIELKKLHNHLRLYFNLLRCEMFTSRMSYLQKVFGIIEQLIAAPLITVSSNMIPSSNMRQGLLDAAQVFRAFDTYSHYTYDDVHTLYMHVLLLVYVTSGHTVTLKIGEYQLARNALGLPSAIFSPASNRWGATVQNNIVPFVIV